MQLKADKQYSQTDKEINPFSQYLPYTCLGMDNHVNI